MPSAGVVGAVLEVLSLLLVAVKRAADKRTAETASATARIAAALGERPGRLSDLRWVLRFRLATAMDTTAPMMVFVIIGKEECVTGVQQHSHSLTRCWIKLDFLRDKHIISFDPAGRSDRQKGGTFSTVENAGVSIRYCKPSDLERAGT